MGAVTTKLPKRKDRKGREKTQKVKMQPLLALSLLSLACLIGPSLSTIEDVSSRDLRAKRSIEGLISNRFSARVPCGRCVHPPCGRCGLTLVRGGPKARQTTTTLRPFIASSPTQRTTTTRRPTRPPPTTTRPTTTKRPTRPPTTTRRPIEEPICER